MNAHDALQRLLLANRCTTPLSLEEREKIARQYGLDLASVSDRASHPGWDKLYYGTQPKKAQQHLDDLAKDFPHMRDILSSAVSAWLDEQVKVEQARQQKKAALAAKRAARSQRAEQAKTLGIDLQKPSFKFATIKTYKALLASLAGVEREIYARVLQTFESVQSDLTARLEASGWDAAKAWPDKNRRGEIEPYTFRLPHPLFWKMFVRPAGYSRDTFNVVAINPDSGAELDRAARDIANDRVISYCAKLAEKIDGELVPAGAELVSASCSSSSIWDGAILTVKTTAGTQVWKTKAIWNRSCLGKDFNQWPTTRLG